MTVPLSVWDPVKRCKVLNPKAFEPEEEMIGQPKTVLNPDAPWLDKPVVKVAKKRTLPPPKDPSKQQRTDRMFELWAKKQGIKHGIK
jgi:hypothetical protein